MVRFAHALPDLRDHVEAASTATSSTRERVLACAVRLLDRGFFRIGSEQYAVENRVLRAGDDAQGARDRLAATARWSSTTRPRAASAACRRSSTRRWPRSSPRSSAAAAAATSCSRTRSGRRWRDVRSDDINEYLKEATGDDFSAKDFRTWNATVLAAVALAVSGEVAGSQDRPQARGHARDQGGRPLPRQHAGRLPRLLHRPARVRRLPRRADHRQAAVEAAASTTGRAADPPPRGRGGRARPAQRARALARRSSASRLGGLGRRAAAAGRRRRRVGRLGRRGGRLAVRRRVGRRDRLVGHDRLAGSRASRDLHYRAFP